MEGIAMQIAVSVIGIVAGAAVTFYTVSFPEIKEKSFRDLEESESEGGFNSMMSSRERRSLRKSDKKRY